MRPKSTSRDLLSLYDVKVQLHNKFVKHIGELKDTISVSKSLSFKDGRELTGHVGSSRESIHYHGWMVSRYDEDRISRHDSALDRGERHEVEVESGGDWFQGLVRHS
jgi:hypothetical protein